MWDVETQRLSRLARVVWFAQLYKSCYTCGCPCLYYLLQWNSLTMFCQHALKPLSAPVLRNLPAFFCCWRQNIMVLQPILPVASMTSQRATLARICSRLGGCSHTRILPVFGLDLVQKRTGVMGDNSLYPITTQDVCLVTRVNRYVIMQKLVAIYVPLLWRLARPHDSSLVYSTKPHK
jgi:hypothetical protein